MKRDHQHVAMVPWLAFGHLIPFLQLSISLAKAGFRITFLSTPKNIQRLPKLPQDLTSQITFVELPLPHVDGLPEGAEATSDLPSRNDELLKKAFDLLIQPFGLFVSNESPDFIVHDVLANWTAEIATRFGVPRVLFSVYSACSLSFMGLMEFTSEDELRKQLQAPNALTGTPPPPWIRFPSPSAVSLLPHEAQSFCKGFFSPDASGISPAARCLSAIHGCEAIVLRSCAEYEGDYFHVLKDHPKPVIPIGMHITVPEKRETASEWEKIFRWLDDKSPRSVVFVVFGSERKLSKSEIYEIAHGLQLSELDFLWALSRPDWAEDDSDVLPPGFVNRTLGRGVVNLGWAPQLDILAHRAIGGCMFHAGWSTLIETVHFGHGLVLLPFSAGQKLDARLAIEKGIGVEVERDGDEMFHGDAIARSLRRAMVGEEAERLRLRSKELMAIFRDQRLSERSFSGFVDFLVTFRSKEDRKVKCSK